MANFESAIALAGLRRVLVVDDDLDVATTIADVLREVGFDTEVAPSGMAALEKARTFRPQVALLDIDLPDLDGYELAWRLRMSGAADGGTTFIAMTGYSERSFRDRSRAAGFAQHLTKPLEIGSLMSAVNAPVRGHP